MRVAFVPRSAEIKPSFWRFVKIILSFITKQTLGWKIGGKGLSDLVVFSNIYLS